jgi:glycosyltransferase involved in cell wall biosynthesis
MHSLSVVIPCLNEERYLPIALRSFATQTDCRLEAIVVDGKSDDQTVDAIHQVASELNGEYFDLKLVSTEKRNVAHQRNLGAKAARYDLIVFMDADSAMPGKGTLDALVGAFEQKRLSVAGTRLKSLERYWLADLYYSIFTLFTWIMQFVKPHVSGAFMVSTRDAFLKLGGFDETLSANEDGDYCRRAKKIGRFAILRNTVYTSSRRFKKQGYLKAGLMSARVGIARIFQK